MHFPLRICSICSEEFELRPDKSGYANRCLECSLPDGGNTVEKQRLDADERKNLSEANDARRSAMRELLYRKDS